MYIWKLDARSVETEEKVKTFRRPTVPKWKRVISSLENTQFVILSGDNTLYGINGQLRNVLKRFSPLPFTAGVSV